MRKKIDHVNQSGNTRGEPSDDVLEAVHAVMHAFRARQYRVSENDAPGVTHLEGKVLGFFARHPGATQGELAAHAGRDKGQIARLIGGLKERGLLSASADEADRRVVRLTLSAEGEGLQQALHKRGRKLGSVASAGLSADERRQLVGLLEKVRQQLEREG